MNLISLLWALAVQAASPVAPAVSYPFAVGEKLSYSAKLGMLTLGSGTLEVASMFAILSRLEPTTKCDLMTKLKL